MEVTLAVHTAHGAIRTIDHCGEIMKTFGEGSHLDEINLHRTNPLVSSQTSWVKPSKKNCMKTSKARNSRQLSMKQQMCRLIRLLAVMIRYFSEKNLDVHDVHPAGLEWMDCVGIGCDGASVMVGSHDSVWTRIQQQNIPTAFC